MKNLKHGNEFANDRNYNYFRAFVYALLIISFLFFGFRHMLKHERPVGKVVYQEVRE